MRALLRSASQHQAPACRGHSRKRARNAGSRRQNSRRHRRKYAADRYRGEIIAERIQDNAENFTRFVFLQPVKESTRALTLKTLLESSGSHLMKMTLAIRLAHRPGSLLASLEPLAQH